MLILGPNDSSSLRVYPGSSAWKWELVCEYLSGLFMSLFNTPLVSADTNILLLIVGGGGVGHGAPLLRGVWGTQQASLARPVIHLQCPVLQIQLELLL